MFFRVVLSIVVGGAVLGQLSAISPDYEKAKIAAARLFKIFDRKSAIDSSSEDGLTPVRMFTSACIFVTRSMLASLELLETLKDNSVKIAILLKRLPVVRGFRN